MFTYIRAVSFLWVRVRTVSRRGPDVQGKELRERGRRGDCTYRKSPRRLKSEKDRGRSASLGGRTPRRTSPVSGRVGVGTTDYRSPGVLRPHVATPDETVGVSGYRGPQTPTRRGRRPTSRRHMTRCRVSCVKRPFVGDLKVDGGSQVSSP